MRHTEGDGSCSPNDLLLPKRLAQLLCTDFFTNKPVNQYRHAELKDIAYALQH